MISELDLVRDYMSGEEVQADHLVDARFKLEAVILAEETPSVAPDKATLGLGLSLRRRRLLTRRVRLSAVAAAALAASSALILQLLPASTLPVAEAAQLRLIATNAAKQSVPVLGRNQWLETKQEESYSIDVTHSSSGPISGTEANVMATSTTWSDNYGDTCFSVAFGTLRFASAESAATWRSVGLSVTPTEQQPILGCDGGLSGANQSNGLALGVGGVVNVSKLPTNAPILAGELIAGTTGVPGIDQFGEGSKYPGFQRIMALLVGPVTGATPAFNAALYKALALFPGVHALGETTTHTGSIGLGFTAVAGYPGGSSMIVVDPNTGALLEAQSIVQESTADLLGVYFSAHEVVTGSAVTTRWLDPTESSSVVNTGSIPSGAHASIPNPSTAVVTAIGKPNVPYGRLGSVLNSPNTLEYLQYQLQERFGRVDNPYAYTASPRGGIMTFTFTGSRAQLAAFVAELRTSNLVASVTVNYPDK
jgi:hypothetical protein